MRNTTGLAALAAAAVLSVWGGDMFSEDRRVPAFPAIDDVTADEWRRLASRRLFFGHQSVGENLIAGIRDVLAARPDIPVRVMDMNAGAAVNGPGLYHAPIGVNGAPATKLDAFQTIVATSFPDSSIAVMKYCYVDITEKTDPDSLFGQYRRGIDSLRAAHPGVTVVHVTLPLLRDPGTVVHLKQILRGRPTSRSLNGTRQRYNELLRQTYGGREPMFDLALLESIRSDGSHANVRYRGATVPTLAPEWTNDGGHLNEAGRRRMAEAFLATLART